MQCGAKTRDGDPCKALAMPNGRCRMHGGTNPGRPIIHGRYSRKNDEALADKVNAMLAGGDPLDVMRPIATAAVALQTYVSRFEPHIPLPAEDIERLISWSESLVRSVTKVVQARNQTALTAFDVERVRDAMADIAKEYVPEDKLSGYFDAIRARLGGRSREQGDNED